MIEKIDYLKMNKRKLMKLAHKLFKLVKIEVGNNGIGYIDIDTCYYALMEVDGDLQSAMEDVLSGGTAYDCD